MSESRRVGFAGLALVLVVGVAAYGCKGRGGQKVWGDFAALGDGGVVATFGEGGLARLGPDGKEAWEVSMDHTTREMMALRLFPDEVVAVAGRLSNGTAVVDGFGGVGVRDGALRFRVETASQVGLGAVAAQGLRRYMVGCGEGGCELMSFDETARTGWARRLEGPGVWQGSTLWALPDGVVVLGNHGVRWVDATRGEVRQQWSTLGRSVRVESRLVWLAESTRAAEWPGRVVGTLPEREAVALLAWTPGSDTVEVLGQVDAPANLVAVGRSGETWVLTASFAGPRLAVFGLARSAPNGLLWRVDLPEGEHQPLSTPLSGWLPHSHPADGLLPRRVPVATFDSERRHWLRWLDLQEGKIIDTKRLDGVSDLEVRRVDERFLVVTDSEVALYAGPAKGPGLRTARSLVQSFRWGQAALIGDVFWFSEGHELRRHPLAR